MNCRRIAIIFALAATIPAQKDQEEFFGLDKSWDVELTIQGDDLAAMYPKGGRSMGMLSQRGRYKYVKGTAKIGGHEFAEVGLRFKGNSTFWMTGGTFKKSYKIDFDRYVEGQKFLGLKKLNLQNNATDPTQVREAVCYELYRRSGVPASRTCFGRVFLTITGKFEKEYLGSYTIVEQVDRAFLARNYPGDEKGLIFKPEGKTNVWLGDRWNEDYEKIYIPKTKVRKKYTAALIGMTRLLAQRSDEVLAAEIEKHLDVSEFLNYCAVTAFTANLDSPFMLAHNYYMAVPQKSKRVVWIPWDLNLSMGGFTMGGRNQQELSVFEPTQMALFQRIVKQPRFRKIYESHLRKLAEGPGSPAQMKEFIAQARQTTAKAIEQEAERKTVILEGGNDRSGLARMFGGGNRNRNGGIFGRGVSIEDFAAQRAPAVIAQLEGKSKGNAAGGSMFGGRARGGASRARAADAALRDMLTRSRFLKLGEDVAHESGAVVGAARKLFGKIDADQSGALTRRELSKILLAQRGQNASPSEARKILRMIDADKNREVSVEEWAAAFLDQFSKWDRDGNGKLDRAELSRQLP